MANLALANPSLHQRRDELRALLDQDRETIAQAHLTSLLAACVSTAATTTAAEDDSVARISIRYRQQWSQLDVPWACADYRGVLHRACAAFGENPHHMLLGEVVAGSTVLLLPKTWTLASDHVAPLELIPKRIINNDGHDSEDDDEGEEVASQSSPTRRRSPAKHMRRQLRRSGGSKASARRPGSSGGGMRRAGSSGSNARPGSSAAAAIVSPPQEETAAAAEQQEIRYVGREFALHALVFMLLSVGLWVNSAETQADYLQRTLTEQLSRPVAPPLNVQFGGNLSNHVQWWEWMLGGDEGGGPLADVLLLRRNRSSADTIQSTCLPLLASATQQIDDCTFSSPATEPWIIGSGSLLVVGSGVQLRQYRVAINTCNSPRFFPCFGRFSTSTMDTRRFGPAATGGVGDDDDNSGCGFTWTNPRQTQQLIPTRAGGAPLDQSGYTLTILNHQQLLPALHYVYAHNWTDAATRAITVQFLLQNPNSGSLLGVQLLAEFSELGSVFSSLGFFSSAGVSPTRMACSSLALIIEVLGMWGLSLLWLRDNHALDGVKHRATWLARTWDVVFVALFVGSFALDAAVFTSAPATAPKAAVAPDGPPTFANVQAMDALRIEANQFRYAVICMLTVRLCGLAYHAAIEQWKKRRPRPQQQRGGSGVVSLVWKIPVLYLVLIALAMPLYCCVSIFWMAVHGSRVDFYEAMLGVFAVAVTGGGEEENAAFVLALLALCWVVFFPAVLAMTIRLVEDE